MTHRQVRQLIFTVNLSAVLLGCIFYFVYAQNYSERQISSVPGANPARLQRDVLALTSTSVPRGYQNAQGLEEAIQHIRSEWQSMGFVVHDQNFTADQKPYKNLITSFGPESGPRIVIGAHYDVADEHPGADDNASGVAGLLELSRLLKERNPQLKYRVDLVAYTLEEPPFFGTDNMGSAVHAKALKEEGVELKLMISLEMIGYFSDLPDSQKFPLAALGLVYPTTGNFIAVIGKMGSPFLIRKVKNLMQESSHIDVQSLPAPSVLHGIDFSDHRNFWKYDYPAVMITDTAFFRNANYHESTDTPATLNYDKMASVVDGVYGIVVGF